MDAMRTLGPRQQGDLGELSAMEWFGRQGARVFVPITHSPDYDLIVDRRGTLERVQVKTSSQVVRDQVVVTICTRGGNQSWNRITNRFDASRCDLLFVLAACGRRWCIPSERVEGTTAIVVSCRKYADFEIEPGLPFEAAFAA